jgi:hypothetical protein
MTLFVSCRRLQQLDLTDLGPQAFASSLLDVELPELKLLRIGMSQTCARSFHGRNDGFRMPPAVLPKVAAAFPSLQALDVGFMPTGGADGVTTAEVKSLLKICAIQHLDLSMVMHLMDFGPTLQALAAHAPELRSLAVHGLLLPRDDMQALAEGCPHLERLHIPGCRDYYGHVADPDPVQDGGGWLREQVEACAFMAFLKTAKNLVELDVSSDPGLSGGAFVPSLVVLKGCVQQWVDTRAETANPVRKVVFTLLGEDYHGEPLLQTRTRGVEYVDTLDHRSALFVELVKPLFMLYQETEMADLMMGFDPERDDVDETSYVMVKERKEDCLRESLRMGRDFLRKVATNYSQGYFKAAGMD